MLEALALTAASCVCLSKWYVPETILNSLYMFSQWLPTTILWVRFYQQQCWFYQQGRSHSHPHLSFPLEGQHWSHWWRGGGVPGCVSHVSPLFTPLSYSDLRLKWINKYRNKHLWGSNNQPLHLEKCIILLNDLGRAVEWSTGSQYMTWHTSYLSSLVFSPVKQG